MTALPIILGGTRFTASHAATDEPWLSAIDEMIHSSWIWLDFIGISEPKRLFILPGNGRYYRATTRQNPVWGLSLFKDAISGRTLIQHHI